MRLSHVGAIHAHERAARAIDDAPEDVEARPPCAASAGRAPSPAPPWNSSTSVTEPLAERLELVGIGVERPRGCRRRAGPPRARTPSRAPPQSDALRLVGLLEQRLDVARRPPLGLCGGSMCAWICCAPTVACASRRIDSSQRRMTSTGLPTGSSRGTSITSVLIGRRFCRMRSTTAPLWSAVKKQLRDLRGQARAAREQHLSLALSAAHDLERDVLRDDRGATERRRARPEIAAMERERQLGDRHAHRGLQRERRVRLLGLAEREVEAHRLLRDRGLCRARARLPRSRAARRPSAPPRR